jgi:hypothetical protein
MKFAIVNGEAWLRCSSVSKDGYVQSRNTTPLNAKLLGQYWIKSFKIVQNENLANIEKMEENLFQI